MIARDHGEAKNSTASANSAGVVTDCSGVLAAIASKTASGVAELASVVRGLRRGVVVVRDHRVLEQVGADVDHAPRPRPREAGQRGLDRVQCALHGAGELCGEGVVTDLVRLGSGVPVEGETGQGVVHDGADGSAELGLGPLEQGLDLVPVADVPAHGERPVRVTAGELAGSILAGEMVDDDLGTFAQEGLGERAAQAASAPGDEHDLLGERGDGAGGGIEGR